MLQNAGYFSSKYTCQDTIASAMFDAGKFWVGTSRELAWIDINTFARNVVEFPDGIMPRVTDIFTDKNHNVWIMTGNSGAYRYNDGSFEQVLASGNVRSSKVLDDGTVCIALEHEIVMWDGDKRVSLVKDSLLGLQEKDGIRAIFCQGQDNLWVETNGYTCAYKIYKSAGVDSIVVHNVYANTGMLIDQLVPVDNFGYLFNTNKGIYRSRYRRTPFLLDEFARSTAPRNIMDVVELGISEQMARATGFKKADVIIYDRESKSLWVASTSGALRLSVWEMESIAR